VKRSVALSHKRAEDKSTMNSLSWTRQELFCSIFALTTLFLLFTLQEYHPQHFQLIYSPFVSFVEHMEGFTFTLFIPSLQVHYTDFIGSLLVCQSYRIKTLHKHWSESLFSCCIGQYGGTTLTALLLGQPPGWMLSHSSFLSLLLAWWLTFFCPFDLFWFTTAPSSESNSLLQPVINLHHSFFVSISSIHAATSWGMDKVLFPSFHSSSHLITRSLLLALLTAVLSSNGGGLTCDLFQLFHQQSFQLHTPTCLQSSPQGDQIRNNLLRSFFLGLVYYLVMNPLNLFPWSSLTQEQRVYGHGIIGCLCVLMWMRSQIAPNVDLIGKVWLLGEEMVCLKFLTKSERKKKMKTKNIKKTD
jgi:hypothetical protein